MKVLVLGGGPSGLVVANYLKLNRIDFQLITKSGHGFQRIKKDVNYQVGQRTLFAHEKMDEFLNQLHILATKDNLSELIGVSYRGNMYGYPLQNHLPFFDRMKMWWSYLQRDRRKAGSTNFADWVVGNFGSWLGTKVILPHTWKTIKEDLWMIMSEHYGQKVVPIRLFGQKSKDVYAYSDGDGIMELMKENVKEHIIDGTVEKCFTDHGRPGVGYSIREEGEHFGSHTQAHGDIMINTIPLPTLMKLIELDKDILDVASRSLRYNNMFISVMIVPTRFIRFPHVIIYFPERKYLFSKVNIHRGNGYSAIVSEVSFRRNDEDLLQSEAYKKKIVERIEYDLKKAGILEENLFTTYANYDHVLKPAYIICDEDYDMYNGILQTWLEHNKIYNVGRFAQWQPHIRVEHSLMRIQELGERIWGIESN